MANIKKTPKGWELKKLKDIGKIISGGTPSTKNVEFWGGEIQWISPSDLTKYTEKRIKQGAKSITELGLKKSSAKLMPKGSILFSSRAPIGYVAIADGELCTNQGFKSIIPNDFIDSDFLYYFLKTSKQTAENAASGTTFKEISLSSFSELTIPYPPLKTQQAIVSKIEELFSELDKGIAELKLAQEQLKVYKQSVLKYAFEGKLTNDNVKDGELPEGWETTSVGELSEVFIGSTPKRNIPEYWGGDINWISSGEVAFKDIFQSKEKISKIGLENSSCKIHPVGTVIIAMIGEGKTRGQAAILKIEASHNQNTAAIRLHKSTYTSELLYYYLVLKYQENRKTGSGNNQKALNKERVKNIQIPLIPLKEQNVLIQEIESRFSVADKMEQSITESLQKAEALRQSILKKAFNGELVKEVKAIEVPKIKNEYFHQLQLVALVINGFKKQKIDHGEMTLAKNLYLLDSIYKIPTGFKYDRWHLGPYPPALKKVVNNKEYFKRNELFIEATNDDKLLKYTNPYQDEVNVAIGDLSAVFSKYKGAERSHKTELLATICKIIEDIKSTDLAAVRQSMAEWKIDLKTSKFKNKAEKFDEPETKKCIEFIVERGWDRKLIEN